MNSNLKTKIQLLIIVGSLFSFFPMFTSNLRHTKNNSNNSSESDDELSLDNNRLKLSKISEKIHIDDNNPSSNWSVAKDAGICTGNGTYSEPYVIEDLVIDGEGSGSGIFIENSEVYFRIENCTIYNSTEGIKLSYVNNSQFNNINCLSNDFGIYLYFSNFNEILGNNASYNQKNGITSYFSSNNNISGNTANNNSWTGIYLYSSSDNNTVSGNTASSNGEGGITLKSSHNNTISGNTAKYNLVGISIHYSDNYTISGNTVNYNGDGIYLGDSDNNILSGNTVNYNGIGIYLWISEYNIISGNTLLGNWACFFEDCEGNDFDCEGNVFENNDCDDGDKKPAIPGYNLFVLFGILSIVTILLSIKVKKS